MTEKQHYIIAYNLQWFAKDGPGGEKAEPATAKKIKEAREEGQVAPIEGCNTMEPDESMCASYEYEEN